MNRSRKLKLLFKLTKLGSAIITGPRAVRLGSYFISPFQEEGRPTLYRGESYISDDNNEIKIDQKVLGDIGRTPNWFKRMNVELENSIKTTYREIAQELIDDLEKDPKNLLKIFKAEFSADKHSGTRTYSGNLKNYLKNNYGNQLTEEEKMSDSWFFDEEEFNEKNKDLDQESKDQAWIAAIKDLEKLKQQSGVIVNNYNYLKEKYIPGLGNKEWGSLTKIESADEAIKYITKTLNDLYIDIELSSIHTDLAAYFPEKNKILINLENALPHTSKMYEYIVFGYYLVTPQDEHYNMVKRYFAHKDLRDYLIKDFEDQNRNSKSTYSDLNLDLDSKPANKKEVKTNKTIEEFKKYLNYNTIEKMLPDNIQDYQFKNKNYYDDKYSFKLYNKEMQLYFANLFVPELFKEFKEIKNNIIEQMRNGFLRKVLYHEVIHGKQRYYSDTHMTYGRGDGRNEQIKTEVHESWGEGSRERILSPHEETTNVDYGRYEDDDDQNLSNAIFHGVLKEVGEVYYLIHEKSTTEHDYEGEHLSLFASRFKNKKQNLEEILKQYQDDLEKYILKWKNTEEANEFNLNAVVPSYYDNDMITKDEFLILEKYLEDNIKNQETLSLFENKIKNGFYKIENGKFKETDKKTSAELQTEREVMRLIQASKELEGGYAHDISNYLLALAVAFYPLKDYKSQLKKIQDYIDSQAILYNHETLSDGTQVRKAKRRYKILKILKNAFDPDIVRERIQQDDVNNFYQTNLNNLSSIVFNVLKLDKDNIKRELNFFINKIKTEIKNDSGKISDLLYKKNMGSLADDGSIIEFILDILQENLYNAQYWKSEYKDMKPTYVDFSSSLPEEVGKRYNKIDKNNNVIQTGSPRYTIIPGEKKSDQKSLFGVEPLSIDDAESRPDSASEFLNILCSYIELKINGGNFDEKYKELKSVIFQYIYEFIFSSTEFDLENPNSYQPKKFDKYNSEDYSDNLGEGNKKDFLDNPDLYSNPVYNKKQHHLQSGFIDYQKAADNNEFYKFFSDKFKVWFCSNAIEKEQYFINLEKTSYSKEEYIKTKVWKGCGDKYKDDSMVTKWDNLKKGKQIEVVIELQGTERLDIYGNDTLTAEQKQKITNNNSRIMQRYKPLFPCKKFPAGIVKYSFKLGTLHQSPDLKEKCPDVKGYFNETMERFDNIVYELGSKYEKFTWGDLSEYESQITDMIGEEGGLNESSLLQKDFISQIKDERIKKSVVSKIIEINKELVGYYEKAIKTSKDKEKNYKKLKISEYKINDKNINIFYNLIKELYYIFDPEYIISGTMNDHDQEKIKYFEKELYSCPPSFFAEIMENSYIEANLTISKKLYNLLEKLKK